MTFSDSNPFMASLAHGTIGQRFDWLMNQLLERFPDPNPFDSSPPELRLLDRLDQALKPKDYKPPERPKDPRFFVSARGRVIDDDDFEHDAVLTISGDFKTVEQRMKYAQDLCNLLNR